MGAQLLGPWRADCTVVVLDGRISVYSPRSQTVHTLSATATAVGHLLDGTRTLERVVADVATSYSTTTEAVEGDVASLVSQLVEDGLLDRRDAS